MDRQQIIQYKSSFDQIVHFIRNEEGEQVEVWFARELQTLLGKSIEKNTQKLPKE
ncbi:MAG: hypothetical protein LBT04_02875 [Prevotellaceae bacterium]|jgi:DNA-damage-inducible protein D|nr:hypothetical protein [Prevotellaceae bacterium]